MSSENKKYYLGFIFDRVMMGGLHCTHCYFGTLSASDLGDIIDIVDAYFDACRPVRMRQVSFNVPCWFGPDRDIRVLLASNMAEFEPMRDLRQHFIQAKFINGDTPFRPHVTTADHPSIQMPFHSYALVQSGEVIRNWAITTIPTLVSAP